MKITSTKFLSMAKIKDYHSVPQYLMDKMSGIVWDEWAGDSPDGSKCTKFACKYIVGEVTFYFVFSRGPYTSTEKIPDRENYLFRSLVAHYRPETKWLGKKYSPIELVSC